MAEPDKIVDWDVTEADPDDGSHGGWTVLEEGYYPFTVQRFERGRFEGSAKMQACPMAVVTLAVQGANGEEARVTERMFMVERLLWKVTSLMEAVGTGRNERGKVIIDWSGLEGRGGWLKLKRRTYTGRDGEQRETNDVERFCKPEEHESAWRAYAKQCGEDPEPVQQAYAPQAQPQYQQQAMAGMPTPQPQAGASQHPGWGIQ